MLGKHNQSELLFLVKIELLRRIIFKHKEQSYDIFWKMNRHRDHQGKEAKKRTNTMYNKLYETARSIHNKVHGIEEIF